MIRRPPRSTPSNSSAASDVYKRQLLGLGFYANRAVAMGNNLQLGTSHSAFVEVLSGGGLLATLPFLLLIFVLAICAAKLLLKWGRHPIVFASTSLLLTTVCIGFISEEMVVASPTSLTFLGAISLLPALLKRFQGKRAFETGRDEY